MKVAVCVHNAISHDARVLKEARTLSGAGHEVRIFGLASEKSSWVTDFGVQATVVPRDTDDLKARLGAIEKPTQADRVRVSFENQGDTVIKTMLSEFEPDVVHLHDHLVLTAARKIKEVTNCPIVWDAHEIYEDLAGVEDARAEVNPEIIREYSPFVDHFVTINESIGEFYARKYEALQKPVILPNSRRLEHSQPYDGRLHQAAGLPTSQKILLFQGGFSNHRGIPQLLESAASLPDGWSIVMMGWGPLGELVDQYKDLVDAGGSRRVVQIEKVPNSELLDWTAGATVGVIPYEPKGLNHEFCTPNKLWEYPLAGVPILATNFPEMAKVIQGHNIGWLLPKDFNGEIIAEVVSSIDEADLQKRTENCRSFVERDNWLIHEKQLVALYDQIEAGLTP